MAVATTRQTFEPASSDRIVFRVKHGKAEIGYARVSRSVLALAGVPDDVLNEFVPDGEELTTEELLWIQERRREAKKGTGE